MYFNFNVPPIIIQDVQTFKFYLHAEQFSVLDSYDRFSVTFFSYNIINLAYVFLKTQPP